MLGITMLLKISARLTPQVTTIIYHHMKKKNIIKQSFCIIFSFKPNLLLN